MSIAAIVVARGGSVRLPRKNLLPFAGKTLVAHKVSQLLSMKGHAVAVYVNTDDAEIQKAAMTAGAIPLQGMDYNGDSNRMIYHSCQQVSEPLILWAHPTNPLVTPDTYDLALQTYHAERMKPPAWRPDSLVSVQRVQRHAWQFNTPLNHDPRAAIHQLASGLKPIHFQDGAIFIRSREAMLRTPRFVGDSPYLFEMPEGQSADIDTMADYLAAKAIYDGIR